MSETDRLARLVPVPPTGFCPPVGAGGAEPHPGNLAYGFSLPACPSTPVIAHETAELVFDVHRIYALAEPGLELVRALTTYACRFAREGQEVHLTLYQKENSLRVDVYDPHACHGCDDLRRDGLLETGRLVRRHHGEWGFDASERPGAGTRTWATLLDVPRRWAA
ncbi:ATP-binding protein [Streptomyces xiamenensis]